MKMFVSYEDVCFQVSILCLDKYLFPIHATVNNCSIYLKKKKFLSYKYTALDIIFIFNLF